MPPTSAASPTSRIRSRARTSGRTASRASASTRAPAPSTPPGRSVGGASASIVVYRSAGTARRGRQVGTLNAGGYAFFQGLDVAPGGRVDVGWQEQRADDPSTYGTGNASIDAYYASSSRRRRRAGASRRRSARIRPTRPLGPEQPRAPVLGRLQHARLHGRRRRGSSTRTAATATAARGGRLPARARRGRSGDQAGAAERLPGAVRQHGRLRLEDHAVGCDTGRGGPTAPPASLVRGRARCGGRVDA